MTRIRSFLLCPSARPICGQSSTNRRDDAVKTGFGGVKNAVKSYLDARWRLSASSGKGSLHWFQDSNGWTLCSLVQELLVAGRDVTGVWRAGLGLL